MILGPELALHDDRGSGSDAPVFTVKSTGEQRQDRARGAESAL